LHGKKKEITGFDYFCAFFSFRLKELFSKKNFLVKNINKSFIILERKN
jgi:hypothetical protein